MLDPFTLLGLERNFVLDIKILEKAYFEAQKKTHPDLFIKASEDVRREAARYSTIVNQAYLTLKDPLKRAEFLLKNVGMELLSHDPLFLEEVMQWNEQRESGKNIKEDLLKMEETLLEGLKKAFGKTDYETARKDLYRLSYVRKLLKEEA